MRLQDKLIELSEYGVTFNVADGKFVVRVKYKKDWDVVTPENKSVSFFPDDADSTLFWYVAPVSTDMEVLFEAIDETIRYNKELEEKTELFREEIMRLQEIFTKEPISVLRTLEYKFKKPKAKKVKQSDKEAGETSTIDNVTREDDDSNDVANAEKASEEKTYVTEEAVKEEATSDIDSLVEAAINNKNRRKK